MGIEVFLIPLPLGSDVSQHSGGKKGFPKEPALAVTTGSCINKVQVLQNKNFLVQRCLLAQETWHVRSSAVAVASSYFDHVPWLLPLYCQTEKAFFFFFHSAIDGFNCPSLFPLGSVLSLRCADQSCWHNFTNDVLWFCVKGELFCFSFNSLIDSIQHFVAPLLP